MVAQPRQATWYRWDARLTEAVHPSLSRRLITGDRVMLAHVYLKKGCLVRSPVNRRRESEGLTASLGRSSHRYHVACRGCATIRSGRGGRQRYIPAVCASKPDSGGGCVDAIFHHAT